MSVFVGLATLDLAYEVDEYPVEDSKVQAAEQFIGAGGPATNAAVTWSFLSGRSATLVTSIGSHPLANLIRHDLTAHHVDIIDATPTLTDPPPVSTIVVARGAQTRTIVSLDASRSDARFDAALRHLVTGAGTVLVDVHHLGLAIGLATAAKEAGASVVLDAGRWKPGHSKLLPLTDIAICSQAFTPPGVPADHGAVIDHLHSLGPTHVAITRGASPIRFSGPGGSGWIGVEQIETAADTLGAGDILHGAFCHFHDNGQPFEQALHSAAAVASLSCRSFGTRAWMKPTPATDLAR